MYCFTIGRQGSLTEMSCSIISPFFHDHGDWFGEFGIPYRIIELFELEETLKII